jgi:hypothetical protein
VLRLGRSIMLYSFRLFDDDPKGEGGDFDAFFVARLQRGMLVLDNTGTKRGVINKVLMNHQFPVLQ